MPRPTFSYGTPNWDLIGQWLHLAPEDEGPWWALNLMQYHEVAQYEDGHGQAEDGSVAVSGKEADDEYAPLGPLAAVGAMVAFQGDVVDQRGGEPAWDRLAIARYPSRAAFFAMQQRDDFQTQHVHKAAGMKFTINASMLATAHDPDAGPASGEGGSLLFVIVRDGEVAGVGEGLGELDGVRPVAAFEIEGVVLGDERRFDRAAFVRADTAAAVDAVVAAVADADEAQVLVLDPGIDHLLESITTAPTGGRGIADAVDGSTVGSTGEA